jgi:hypothetical protein
MQEVCNTDIWKRNHKTSKWSVNTEKLEIMVESFASVRSDSGFEGVVKPDPFLIVEYGDEPYIDESRQPGFSRRVPRY